MSDADLDLTPKEFARELAAFEASLRREIEAKASGFDSSPEAVRERRARVLRGRDFEFFAWHYFPHHIWGDPSKFQGDFCARFPTLLEMGHGCREWFVAPRGEAKSTLIAKIGPVYTAVRHLLQRAEVRREVGVDQAPVLVDYGLIFSAESTLAEKLLAVVKTELAANPRLACDFPEVAGAGEEIWTGRSAVTRNGVRFDAFGAGRHVRGTFHGSSRPQVAFGDDLIKDDEARSPTQCAARWEWFEMAVDNLGPPGVGIKFIGAATNVSSVDLVSRARQSLADVVHTYRALEQMPERMDLWEQCEALMRNEDRRKLDEDKASGRVTEEADLPSYQFYLANRAEMDAGAVVSWAARTLYGLMRKRANNRNAFEAELQNNAQRLDEKVFTDLTFWVSRLQHWVFFGGCDPSMGKGQSSDPSGIVVGGFDRNIGKLHLIDARCKRRVPTALLADLEDAQAEFNVQSWGFENNNAYEYMRTQFQARAAEKGVDLRMAPVTTVAGMDVEINGMQHLLTGIDPRILVHAKLYGLLQQLDTWPQAPDGHHYDLLSALVLCWKASLIGARPLSRRIVTRAVDGLSGLWRGR